MCSKKTLPFLPGYVFDHKIGHERWHKSSQLNWINGQVPYLVEQKRPAVATGYPFPWNPPPGRYPSLYPQKPHSELPSWIVCDKQVLCFSAYFYDTAWDTSNDPQRIRMVKLNFFLEDGTLQVNEDKLDNSGLSQGTILSRQRVPFPEPMERAYYQVTDFNIGKPVELFSRTFYIVSCDNFTRQWLNRAGIAVPDPIDPPEDITAKAQQKRRETMVGRRLCFRPPDDLGQFLKFDRHVLRFYGYWDDRDSDLSLGVVINLYGRAFKLTNCDEFTKQYYRVKYGLENFGENSKDDIKELSEGIRQPPRELPPWNGIGGFDDSAANCLHLVPKAPRPLSRQLDLTGSGRDSHILRFKGRLITTNALDRTRNFTIGFHLTDDTTSIFETAKRNSGYNSCMLFGKREAMKPCSDLFVSHKPEIYKKEDFWVGNTLEIDKLKYELLEADEYGLRYMELNPQEFPKSNIDMILMKIRQKLAPQYKSFICTNLLPDGDENFIPKHRLSSALQKLLGNEITPHEIITTCRHFAIQPNYERHSRQYIKNICQNECHRLLFIGQERLAESLRYRDPSKSGFVTKHIAYRLCRGARIPIDPVLLEATLNKVEKNENGDVNIADLMTFFETKDVPVPCIPISQAQEFSIFPQLPLMIGEPAVNVTSFLERLGLEDNLKKES